MSIPYPGEIPNRLPTTMQVSAEWGNALRQRIPHVHATKDDLTDALGPSPLVGTIGFVTGDSTNAGWWVYSGGTVGWTRPWDGPWGSPDGTNPEREFGNDQSGISTVTDVSGLTIVRNAIHNRFVELEVYVPHVQQLTAAGAVTFQICTAANAVLTEWRRSVALNEVFSVRFSYPYDTSAAGSITRKVRASTSAGTLAITTSGAGQSAWFEARDVGPAGGPA